MRMHSLSTQKIKRRRGLPTRVARGLAALVIAGAPVTAWVHSALAESDTTAPVLSGMTADTNTVNVDTASAQVTISGYAYDDMSGFHDVESYFTSPSSNLAYAGNFGITSSPDENNITSISITVNFPQNTEPGVWRPHFTAYDETGNFVVLDADTLVNAGFNLDITVQSANPDATAPTLTNLYWDQPGGIEINTTSPNHLLATLDATDANPNSNVEVTIELVSPSSVHRVHTVTSRNAGSTGTFDGDLQFPAYVEAGAWSVYLTICDGVGNCHLYEPSELQAMTLPSTIDVVSALVDTTPVSIDLLDIAAGDPTFDTINIGGAAISTRVEFSDDLSGLEHIYLTYRSQTTNQVSSSFGLSGGQDNVSLYLNATLPPYAAAGLWLPEIYTDDIAGNEKTYSHQDLLNLGFDLSLTFGDSVVATAPVDGTVSSDIDADGATATDPIEASVTTPTGGNVSVAKVELAHDTVTTPGYSLAGQQVSISAPLATPEAPMTLSFTLDASQIPEGQDAQSLVIFRNATLIAPCQDSIIAIPDPCVFSSATLPDGDVQVTVHTSTASVWAMGFPDAAQALFQGFKNPVKDAPKVNKVEAGEVVPVKFWFGDNSDATVLSESNITSREVSCTTLQPIGSDIQVTVNGNGVKANGNVTKFNWKTVKKWKHSCRQLSLTFSNGETAYAYFKFKD